MPGSVLPMVRLGKQSRKTAAAVLEAAERHFGAGGAGLTVTQRSPADITFQGTAGRVIVTVTVAADGKRRDVDIVSHEWDAAARGFLRKI